MLKCFWGQYGTKIDIFGHLPKCKSDAKVAAAESEMHKLGCEHLKIQKFCSFQNSHF